MAVRDRLASRLGLDDSFLTEDLDLYLRPEDLPRLADFGIEVGNHTRSHVHCRGLDPQSARAEILDAKAELEAWTGCRVRAFSFPYGSRLDATPLAMETIAAAGHDAVFFASARANHPASHGEGPRRFDRVAFAAEPASQLFLDLEVFPLLRG